MTDDPFEVKACPHCGHPGVARLASYAEGGTRWAAMACGGCNARGPEVTGRTEIEASKAALAAWNRRDGEAAVAALLRRYVLLIQSEESGVAWIGRGGKAIEWTEADGAAIEAIRAAADAEERSTPPGSPAG